ncbi:uncharacterized protein HMPREF1541_04948 [Cyphellophora europaea CBS 101466]|uniref:Protein transport protein sec16 n=1 Tax=Cyphellophora europaea (strain CBS 101466) TaxID=1220924 RepID=W2RYB2_CYPE1|nr:uncharacterized protein HMPREF1541_04948 [Cyphellophora europaea CBS 101466]ETN40669.1 hypothetical protein HMPREF1541_04948 [Cyphellophora europaea CBS 101466]
MEGPNTYNIAAPQAPDEIQAGHWQPALRPNDPPGTQISQPVQPTQGAEALAGSREGSVERLDTHWSQEAAAPQQLSAAEDLQTSSPDPTQATGLHRAVTQTVSHTQQDISAQEPEELEDDGDDERLDPAWSIKRMNTAQILSSVNRTASFPTFTSIDRSEAHPPAAEQPENQKTSVQESEQLYNHEQADGSRPLVQSKPEFNWDQEADPEAEHYLRRSDVTPPQAHIHDPEESRFEEGLPLVQAVDESEEQPAAVEDSTQLNGFETSSDDHQDSSFFSGLNESHQTFPPELTRKSTSAVLGALNMTEEPHHELDEDHTFFSSLQSEQTEAPAVVPKDDAARPAEPASDKAASGVDDIWNAMAEDDEFLVEDPDDLLPDSEPSSPSSFTAALKQDSNSIPDHASPQSAVPQRPLPPRQSSNPYAPHQPSTAELSEVPPMPPGIGSIRPGSSQFNSFQSHQQHPRPAMPQPAQSFVDQKSGYQSPYDLPMELSKPKKRPAVLQQVSSTRGIPPPPRSSSITEKPAQSPFGFGAANSAQPSPAYPPRDMSGSVPPSSGPAAKRSSSFFEELPISSKPRAGSGGGRYTPQQGAPSIAPPPMASPPHAAPMQPQIQPVRAQSSDPLAQFQLRAPAPIDPFPNTTFVPGPAPALVPSPAAASRYSPAPPSLAAPRTGPSPRYSPAPPPQAAAPPTVNRYASQPSVPQLPQQPTHTNRHSSQPTSAPSPPVAPLPFQPRTSSPLVHHKSSVDESQQRDYAAPSQPVPPHGLRYGANGIASPPANVQSAQTPAHDIYSSPPKAEPPLQPPKRSQTQSPSKQRPQATPPMSQRHSGYRPASAHGSVAPMRPLAQVESAPFTRAHAQGPSFVEQVDFVQPTDELRFDPLERWKGAPVLRFGFGGAIVSTFPKHVPRYSAGAVKPQIKPTVGDVSVRESKSVLPGSPHVASFPGPLKTKSRKKELLVWLSGYITELESHASLILPAQSLPDPRKRHEEKIMLWKIIKSMVEHDGALDSGEALKAVNVVLAPEIHAVDESTATQYGQDISPSIYRPLGTSVRPENVDPMAVDTVRKHLLRGNRKEAVWHAVDHRLWSHAFLIGSTMPRDTWKQVVSEFVKQEVKTAGTGTESLSTLYEIFGGNAEDCVDQLVPPSARAGLQLVSKIDSAGPTKNALDGLDKWRETLSLIINNRSHADHQALASLGRLLLEYGRIEAAHVCFLFSRSATNPTIVGGLDEPQASIVLLGADHRKQPFDFARDLDAILLTEVYEFATLVLTGSTTAFMPYLSTYKLRHASLLAEEGSRTEAQAYCDALTATLRNTKVSSYYAPAFLGELEDFSNRLKQVPIHSSSWMGKPNLEKVSGSILSKLSNFVAGEDSDAESKGSGREAGEAGPFAHVAGTPSLSRTTSQSDIQYGYATSAPQSIPTTMAGSRYAPNGLSSARSSSELTRGRPSLDSQRSPPSSSYAPNGRPSPYDPINMMQSATHSAPVNPFQSMSSPPLNRYQATPPHSSYAPNATSSFSPQKDAASGQNPDAPASPPALEPYMPTPPAEPIHVQSDEPSLDLHSHSYQPLPRSQDSMPTISEQANFGGYAPPEPTDAFAPNQSEPATVAEPDTGYAPAGQSYGYAPPENTGYVPYTPDPDSPAEQSKPRKMQFGEDDDNLGSGSKSTAPADDAAARKAANDAAADAAFRAAAEADAAQQKEKTVKAKSSGWFGGWLGGAKKSESLDAGSSSKSGKESTVYRAKLGESKMKLYYDKDLKKWVNPDNPDAGKSTPTPPPPRAASGTPGPPMAGGMAPPPPRSISAAPPMASPGIMTPGSGPPSRAATPASGSSAPGISATLPPNVNASLSEGATGGFGLPSGPPSRPGTAMSNASSIDDLLGGGPPMGGKRGAKGAKAKKGRYVDVMAK